MKRQQAISRFFAPKTTSSSGTRSNSTPSTSSHANRRPLETPPSVIGSPRALAPGGASKSIVQGFAFSPAAKKRRASEEEETEPSQDVLGSGGLEFPQTIHVLVNPIQNFLREMHHILFLSYSILFHVLDICIVRLNIGLKRRRSPFRRMSRGMV